MNSSFNEEKPATQGSEEQEPSESAERLFPLVYSELRALAHSWFAHEPVAGSLQPTAIVHEAYVRLAAMSGGRWKNRIHFRAVAAKAMRHILIDHARRRNAAKRGGGRHRVTLSEAVLASGDKPVVDLLDLDDALTELSAFNERQGEVAELRFLGGFTVEEVANYLNISERTVKLEWKMARAWLLCKLDKQD